MKRAAFETYRRLKAAGRIAVRDWLNVNFAEHRGGDLWRDLWALATSIDFKLADASQQGGEAGVIRCLHSDDSVELGLRRISAHVYLQRTGDQSGADKNSGLAPPGAGTDIGPSWLIDEATTHSKNEHQRTERVRASRSKGGKAKETKGDKSKGAKGGGKASPAHA